MFKQRQSNARNGNLVSSTRNNQLERQNFGLPSLSWEKLVMDLYPPGSAIRNWTCTYCNIIQPPRSKHCHDCDKCVLQFDHHCVWLGICIGQRNCRFWWYIFEETILCVWTVVLYITFLRSKLVKAWWKDLIVIVLLTTLVFSLIFLLVLLLFHSYLMITNQTTYEMVRRRRILYLRFRMFMIVGESQRRFIHLAEAFARTCIRFVAPRTACTLWKLSHQWRNWKQEPDLTLVWTSFLASVDEF
ncbi:zinc finger protein, partial [Musa troglodytarum]